jgi:N-acetylmuramoyl-L-alanine amidase
VAPLSGELVRLAPPRGPLQHSARLCPVSPSVLFLACLSWLAVACGHGSTVSNDSGAAASEASDISAARALSKGGLRSARLPARADALALAESIEARAVREGAGARAVDLHTTAARLLERVWRVEGRERDAAEALDLYRAAARDATAPGACEAALGAARLAGDLARDATATYGALYRVQRRFASVVAPETGDACAPTSCRRDVEDGLAALVAFRPPRRVLDAIDEGLDLAGETGASRGLALAADAGPAQSGKPPQLVRIESWPGRDAARIVLVLDRPAAYRVADELLSGNAAPRTFLDLDGVDLGGTPREQVEPGVVPRVRAEATSTGSRVSLDIDGRAWRRVFSMHDPYRIVIDVTRRLPGSVGRGPREVARVVLDPGHGGKDTGAVGPSGVREKEVTLDIAHRVALILAGSGVQVVLTREDDRFVSLEERTARANGSAADLFISIHCNASESKARRGVETYVLDTTRDEIAARVAARENATTQAATAELASILSGMHLADQAQRSTRLARLLERSASSVLQTKYGDSINGGVHTAGFYVLVGAGMPSVLFETSYISNAVEEQRLGSEDYRQLLADAIANAVKAYREGR